MPILAFQDNYIWLIHNPINQHCIVVDPGDAVPVLNTLSELQLTLSAILITHHHFDHIGGILKLIEKFPVPVYGPAHESIPGCDHPLKENDVVKIDALSLTFRVLDIPGHTRGHIAYYGHKMLFCGDTLFASGCGRLFEGTANQMYQSLLKIRQLPEETLIYCAHEYTAANLRFAATVEPNNQDIQQRIEAVAKQRKQGLPTLPSILSLEKLTNPFLRCDQDSVIESARQHCDAQQLTPVNIFQAVRQWKDAF